MHGVALKFYTCKENVIGQAVFLFYFNVYKKLKLRLEVFKTFKTVKNYLLINVHKPKSVIEELRKVKNVCSYQSINVWLSFIFTQKSL